MLSVVIPSFNEEPNIQNTAKVISGVLDESGIDFEIIFSDDGSGDGTWNEITVAHDADPRVCGIRFSRNFGKESAIWAGLEAARGDCAVVIDCDLQHPPKVIPEMYRLWQNGAEVVEGKKSSRGKESGIYKAFSNLFYKLIASASGIDMANTSDFKLLDRKVIDAILSMSERTTFFRALSGWVGFHSESITYDVEERAFGEKKWTPKMLIKYAVKNLMAFTSVPLYLSGVLGGIISAISAVLFILKCCGVGLGSFGGSEILLLLTGGLILICLSIIGRYLAQIYEEIKHRPKYIISDTIKSHGGQND
ncbi:MAG: glycosyltransferase family 2 protein [Oscillospiraceae bacterium]|nr:glycosyltransferase family 2 protein [Oscillospiraceae bacterium]